MYKCGCYNKAVNSSAVGGSIRDGNKAPNVDIRSPRQGTKYMKKVIL